MKPFTQQGHKRRLSSTASFMDMARYFPIGRQIRKEWDNDPTAFNASRLDRLLRRCRCQITRATDGSFWVNGLPIYDRAWAFRREGAEIFVEFYGRYGEKRVKSSRVTTVSTTELAEDDLQGWMRLALLVFLDPGVPERWD
ncbi:MAG: hypothetical protein C7B44_06750 [Sulfobacillus thermosulfidooxidans]|uniref:hypothetical protein n=1 Tax=Sulfobacillus sp. hq2 TaxID=2039167 RepID=UPI000CD0C44C|nr:hypothetical protein [Sulfobacillus sp. hq2]POB09877.1 hypothetical protein CO251_13345 [Sulfobacillus sp. hq2]PSR36866.1 MAG: hypothetical protein C7B44_06750 [Sulfobacillus thermosulfidooxidans]